MELAVSERAVEEPPPVLYRLKKKTSAAYRMATLPFSDRTSQSSRESADRLNSVAAMIECAFQVECGGGSAFRFKESNFKNCLLGRTIGSFYRPRPSTELSLVIFQALSKRLNRHCGWQS